MTLPALAGASPQYAPGAKADFEPATVQCYLPDSPEGEAALEALSQVMAEDSPTLYMARPGEELAFFRKVLLSTLQLSEEPLRVLQLGGGGCSCVALVHNVLPKQAQQRPEQAQQAGLKKHLEAWKEAMEALDLEALLRLGSPRPEAEMLLHACPARLGAVLRVTQEADKVMRAHEEEHRPLQHLQFLATEKAAQGRGLGSKMLAHLGRLADSEGQWMWIEASSEGSRRLYLRHGFLDACSLPLGEEGEDGAPVFRMMLRPPAALREAVEAD